MSQDESFPEYTEEAAIDYIVAHLPEQTARKFSEKEILEIIDLIFDYYDEAGLLDFSDLDNDADETEMVDFIERKVGPDKYGRHEPEAVVRLEMEYEDSLNIF